MSYDEELKKKLDTKLNKVHEFVKSMDLDEIETNFVVLALAMERGVVTPQEGLAIGIRLMRLDIARTKGQN